LVYYYPNAAVQSVAHGKVTHVGIYTEAGIKGELGNIILRFEGGFLLQAIVVHGGLPPVIR
jgi:hypothetical protein